MAPPSPTPDPNLANDMAALAAAMYAALLDVRVPSRRAAVFSQDQAFTLVNTMFYQAVRDEGLL